MGDQRNSIEVAECTLPVLVTVINHIYGMDLGEEDVVEVNEDFVVDEAEGLLTMANKYQLDGLKDAVADMIGKRGGTAHKTLKMLALAEKYNAGKLKDRCVDFLVTKAERLDIAKKILRADLDESFKKSGDFQSPSLYRDYMEQTLKPNMIVRCMIKVDHIQGGVAVGEIGKVVSISHTSTVSNFSVKWQADTGGDTGNVGGRVTTLLFHILGNIEILTPPVSFDF